jgi:hypothetical protein
LSPIVVGGCSVWWVLFSGCSWPGPSNASCGAVWCRVGVVVVVVGWGVVVC